MLNSSISRSPIYNRKLEVFGYELRVGAAGPDGGGDMVERLRETARLIPLNRLTGDRPALIRLPARQLSVCEDLAWPGAKLVVAIADPVLDDPSIVDAASALAAQGYTIAIDHPSDTIDAVRRNPAFVAIHALRASNPSPLTMPTGEHRPRLMVRELEHADEYDRFSRLGFDFYAGKFFERPRLIHGMDLAANRLSVVELLARLQDPDIPIADIEDLVSRDVVLSYKLLRLLNSAYFGARKQVDSIRRAVIFFGLQRLKNWASVALINAVDFKPRELLTTALLRARLCELLAIDLGRSPSEPYYLAGLFSLLDAIMDAPMQTIVDALNLSPELKQALLRLQGPVGEVLAAALRLERGLPAPGDRFSREDLPLQAYLQAIEWASVASAGLEGLA